MDDPKYWRSAVAPSTRQVVTFGGGDTVIPACASTIRSRTLQVVGAASGAVLVNLDSSTTGGTLGKVLAAAGASDSIPGRFLELTGYCGPISLWAIAANSIVDLTEY